MPQRRWNTGILKKNKKITDFHLTTEQLTTLF